MKTPPTPRSGRTAVAAPAPVHHAPNAALLIDFDNVTLGIRSDLTKELRSLLGSEIIKGKVAVQRAYADWRRYPQYIVPLSESSIDLIFAPAFGTNKKNATDIRLAVDAIELVFTRPEIGTIILLSGDSDFSSLVLKLKEYGKYVIGVGIRESASDILIQNCDEYYSYSDLAGLTREAEGPSVQRDPWELVVEATAQMAQNGDVMRSDRLKQVMQQIDPNFDEKNAGFSRFSKFVTAAGDRGLISVTKLDNGQFEVAPVAGGRPAKPSGPASSAAPRPEGGEEGARRGRRRGRGRGRGRDREREEPADAPELEAEAPPAEPRARGGLTLAEAFQLLQRALAELRTPVAHEMLRARMVALLGREDLLLGEDRFPRLLRQANDAEVADVRKVADDKFEVSPQRTQALASAAAKAARGAAAEAATPSLEAPSAAGETESDRRPAAVTRFRRGSRAPARPAEVALVGAVRIGGAPPAVATPATKGKKGAKAAKGEAAPAVADTPAPAARGRGKKARGAGAEPPAPPAEAAPKAAKKSPRGRSRGKSKA